MKKFLFITAFVSASFFSFAQKRNIYFLTKDGKRVSTRDSAEYIRVISEPDSGSVLYNVAEYYKNGKKKLIGKSSAINPPIFEGNCLTFFDNGKRQSILEYKSGIKINNEYDYFTNGKPRLIINHLDGDYYGQYSDHYLITMAYDSLGTVFVKDGNGYIDDCIDTTINFVEHGKVKGGKRDSIWKGKGEHASFVETYNNGKLVSGMLTTNTGQQFGYTKARYTPAEYKGGLDEFYKLIMKNIDYPRYERNHNIQGKVFVKFTIETNGSITAIKVTKSSSSINLDWEAIKVIKKSPVWIPATLFGTAIKEYFSIPINFSL